MPNLSTRGRIVVLVVLAALPALALTVYSTWDERVRAQLRARDNLQRLATLAAQRQEQLIEGARSLIQSADESLYEAKGAGRDRVIVSRSK